MRSTSAYSSTTRSFLSEIDLNGFEGNPQGAASQTAKLLDAYVFDQLIMVAPVVTKIELAMCSAELCGNGPITREIIGILPAIPSRTLVIMHLYMVIANMVEDGDVD